MSNAQPLLRVADLTKVYRTRDATVVAFEHISFEVRQGEIVCLLGPSGCGKSSLLLSIAGLQSADAGEVLLNGNPLREPHPDVAVVFQDPCLLPWRNVWSNVALGLQLRHEQLPSAVLRRRVQSVLCAVGLEAFARHYPHQLSAMNLYLIESSCNGVERALLEQRLQAVETRAELLEAQASAQDNRLYVVLLASDEQAAREAFAHSGLQAELVKQVRLVGQDLETVRQRKARANYLVEWNLPAGLTMEAYLKRKAEKSPLYAQVPEVKFERTYVCEDMSKCLCLYDSPDEQTVLKAREVVGAPVDHVTTIQNVR
jgi:ABC-type phosphate transport system ATPase subunit